MKRSVAAIVLCALLLAGCGRGAHRTAPAPSAPAPASAVTGSSGAPAGGSGNVDGPLKSVDGLLSELDNQVNTDGSAPPDAD